MIEAASRWPHVAGRMAELIRAHDWAGTPLGAAEGWPASLKTAVEMMLASPMLASLAVGPERVFLYNDEASRHYGDRHPGALGRPLAQVFAHEFARVADHYDRVFAGESLHVPAQPLDPTESGQEDLYEAYLTPVLDDDGVTIAAFMTGFEAHARLRTEAALRDSEARLSAELAGTELLRHLAERLVPEESTQTFYEEILTAAMMITRSDAGTIQLYEPATRSLVLLVTSGCERDMTDHFRRVDANSHTACGIALGTNQRTLIDFEDETDEASRMHVAAGYRSAQATPLLARDGRPLGMLNTHWHAARHRPKDDELRFLDLLARQAADLIEARQTRDVLCERDTQLILALDIGEIGHWTYDLATGDLITSEHCRRNFGRPPELPFSYDELTASIHPDDVAKQQQAVDDAVATRSHFETEYRVITPQGETRWVHVQGRFANGKKARLVGVSRDITNRRRDEERQAFLLELSDTLRSLSDPFEIQYAAMKILANHFDVMRAGYMDVAEDGDTATMSAHFERGAPFTPDSLKLSDFGVKLAEAFARGETCFVRNAALESPSEKERAAHNAIGVQSWIIAPLVKRGRLIAIVGVVDLKPRDWTEAEVQLVTDVAARTWDAVERAHAVGGLRESEERLHQFGEASQDVLWIRDAETLQWTYLTPAFDTIYGLSRDDALAGENFANWLDLILPEDRDHAVANIARVRAGEQVAFEFRIRRTSDGAVRWMRNTDFPIRDVVGNVVLIGGIGSDVTVIKEATQRQDLLLAELQHRVRNILGMVRAMVRQSAVGHDQVEDYTAHLFGRLDAMGRTQVLLTRAADARVDLEGLVRDELEAHAARDLSTSVSGPRVTLSPKAAEALTLAIHELATNSVKYGALARDGRLAVAWNCHDRREVRWLEVIWDETGCAPLPAERKEGFGTELIEQRVPYELRGESSISMVDGKVTARIAFPLIDGTSIFESGPVGGGEHDRI